MYVSSIMQFYVWILAKIPVWFLQYALFSLRHAWKVEKWKSAVDKGKSFGTLLTDPSKAFAR